MVSYELNKTRKKRRTNRKFKWGGMKFSFNLRPRPNFIDVKEIYILSAIAAVAGLISMVGDLCASAIKRNYDIKDYGHLIPGHGGILDRFDSMIITAPIIYYLSYYFLT